MTHVASTLVFSHRSFNIIISLYSCESHAPVIFQYVFHKDPYSYLTLNVHAEFTRKSCCNWKRELKPSPGAEASDTLALSVIYPYLITRNCQTGQISTQWELLLKDGPLLSLAVNVDSHTTNPYPSWPSPRFGRRLGIHCIWLIFSVILFQNHPNANPNSALCPTRMTTTDPISLPNYSDTVWSWCSCTAVESHCHLPCRSASWGNIFSQLLFWCLKRPPKTETRPE